MTIWIPDRQTRTKAGRFTSKVDAFSRARHVYVCKACSAWHPKRLKKCDAGFVGNQVCGGELLCMDSKAEAKRYAELRLMERYNDIGPIEVHPRFPCVVNDVLVCTYIADFAYVDRESKRVIEDVKGNKDFTDSASALRRKFAEALHGFKVRIVEVR